MAKRTTFSITLSGDIAPQKLTEVFKSGFARALAKQKGGRIASPKAGCPGICPQKLGGRPIKRCKIRATKGGGITVTCEY